VNELEAALSGDPLPIDEGRTLLALGVALRRLREHRRSREATERALAIFERLGTPPWTQAARSELGRLPGRRPGAEGELTNAEAAIARLVAAGRSNREVATELVLSVKTVEVTLTRVYEKLGLRSRTELAARLRPSAEA
jgi:DNA-binding NarL/FixJ family response regulator